MTEGRDKSIPEELRGIAKSWEQYELLEPHWRREMRQCLVVELEVLLRQMRAMCVPPPRPKPKPKPARSSKLRLRLPFRHDGRETRSNTEESDD